MEVIRGTIQSYDERTQTLLISAHYTDYEKLAKRGYKTVDIGLNDSREISPDQRAKAYALMHDIAEWSGDLPDYVKRLMKIDFLTHHMQTITADMFSLSNCDMTLAREFITFLIDFCLEHDVPLGQPILQVCDDIEKAVYACLKRKKCIICGDKADLHHVDAVGMGRDRKDILQLGMRVLPLCRKHHTEAHTRGVVWLLNDMHLIPYVLDREIGKIYGLTKKNLGEVK